jgi:rRNA maturation endonuclease Nob1
MLAIGGLTLVLASFALWRVLDPLTDEEEVRGPAEKRAPHRIRELEREKLAVLKAIKEIELDYQMRKIAEPDYREMVERYRSRALRIMGELAMGDDYRALIEHELKGRLAVIRATASSAATTTMQPAGPPPEPASDAPGSDAAPGAADPAPTEKIVSHFCGACRSANDADARFCKRCGGALLATVASPAPSSSGVPE